MSLTQLYLTLPGYPLTALALLALARQWRALARARRQAHTDDTTGLANRRAFHHHLQQALHRDGPVGVVLLDLDRFKAVNDAYGHRTGNQVLAAIGTRLAVLNAPGRPKVLAARLSGDEFALLVHGDRTETAALAHHVWQAVAQPLLAGGQEFTIYASVGYATAALGISAEDLLHHADLAMYRAKTSSHDVVAADTTSGPPTATHPAGGPVRPRDRRQPH